MFCASVALIGMFLTPAHQDASKQTNLASTTIPVVLTQTIDASKAKVGDLIEARTIQIVLCPDGTVIPKGTTIVGHLTAVRPFSFDPTPYAVQQPSFIAIHFDKVMNKTAPMELNASLRAAAGRYESADASSPHYLDEKDIVGTMFQIGGDTFTRHEQPVVSHEGDIVGYNKKGGVFAHLLPNEYSSRYSHFQCDGTSTEQSVAMYSASACGLYGFGDIYIADNGDGTDRGTFRLESRRRTVKIEAQSTALLEVVSASGRGSL
jgi:hypothetical protein